MARDGLQAGEDQQRCVTHVPPGVNQGLGGNGPLLAAEECHAGEPRPLDQLVHHADLVVEHPEPQQCGDDVGHQVRHQQGAADDGGFDHLVHKERQAQGQCGLQDDVQENVLACDGQGIPEQRVPGDSRVIVHPYPFRVSEDVVLGEAEVHAADGGDHVEGDEPDHCRGDEKQCDLEVPELAEAASALRFFRYGRNRSWVFGKGGHLRPFPDCDGGNKLESNLHE
ncbi:hypothetical protein QF038_000571 [Pseudarthrobacter sp. W1I19]|nr:hypothetical protein [Pseudarthrobacter sp. W1I19]